MIQVKNWSQDHSSKIVDLLKSKLSWTVELTQADEQEVVTTQDLSKFKINKFPIAKSKELLIHYPAQPQRVQLIETMDSLIEVTGQMWPDLLIVPAIRRAIRRKIKTLDLNRAAYVVGEDAEIRPLVAVASELGFSNITLVSTNLEWLEEEKKFLSRRLVGIQLDAVLTSDLTLQSQNTVLLLNSLNLHKNKDYLHDLAYFNFMVTGGVVVDLCSDGPHQTLQEEAMKAQLTCIKPMEILLSWWLEAALKLKPTVHFTREQENLLFESL